MSLLIWQVFSKGTMDAFILRSIYPKLSQCLSEFIINPHQQHLGMWHFHLQPQIVNSPHWQPYISWHIKCENMAFHQASPSISSFDLLYNFLFPCAIVVMLFMNFSFNIFIEPFHWVIEWEDIITQQHFISLLEKHFFPRWIQVRREVHGFLFSSLVSRLLLKRSVTLQKRHWISLVFVLTLFVCICEQVLRGWLSVSPNYDEVIQW